MQQFKYLIILAFIILILTDSFAATGNLSPAKLQNGDLIFQTSTSGQSKAIMMATQSVYTHMGIIKWVGSRISVVEAAGPVRETPLEQWIQHGVMGRITIVRHKKINGALANQVLLQAKRYYGQQYDSIFRFNNGRLYCSELPYLAYHSVGLSIGRVQAIFELKVNNPAVEQLMRARWQNDPVCSGIKSFEACKPKLFNQKLVTPVTILQDENMVVIFSNYPPIATSLTKLLMR